MACTDGGVAEPPAVIDLSDVYPFTLEDCRGALAPVAGKDSCDPINLVFPRRSVQEVRDALVTAGWTTAGFGSVQSVFLEAEQTLQRQSVQLFKDDDGASLVEPSRYHIRLWQMPGEVTIGAVHHESGLLAHTIDVDWEISEAEVRNDLCKAIAMCSDGLVLDDQSRLQGGDQEWRERRNDARPLVILIR